ncbi:leucyl aminopeptidase family protein [Paenibacillus massiliensis]|uniref:leucyl aminopeptidase family protein n=1 Tax=Paenibacillus massiliensis TaxID=225917 RepID=UPI0004722A7E|nr:leucyl aminopeptidase family protein [Paenibacillus massiliensis]
MSIVWNAAAAAEVHIYIAYEQESCGLQLRSGQDHHGVRTWFYGRQSGEEDILVIGMGSRSELTLERIRRAAGTAARELLRQGRSQARLVAQSVPGSEANLPSLSGLETEEVQGTGSKRETDSVWLQAWTEGWLLGLYRFNACRGVTARTDTVELLLTPDDWPGLNAEAAEAALEIGRIRVGGTILARDYVNETPERLHPEAFASQIAEHFSALPIRVKIYDEAELIRRQMNGLLTVGGGSEHKPALVELTYEGELEGPLLVLVGKGITFDMGGMNVKTARDISDARMDMGGAAAVLGAMDILARSHAKVRVTALIAIADNLPGTGAMLPSSVITYPNGLTVQVANTDGEGRLVIADALLHAAKLGAEEVIDIATLTGNVGAALGLELAGIWGDDRIVADMKQIGDRNGERLWHMPLVDEYEDELRSDYADLRNVGTGTMAGAITAALFIRRFVNKSIRWAHIDMAGTVQYKSERPYSAVGATGYGARLLADYAMHYADKHQGD